MRLEIPKWDELQHFKKRDPIWIRLYRKLRHKRSWRKASHGAAKLLVDLWLIASEGEELGVVDMEWDDLAYETRENVADLQHWVQELDHLGLISLISAGYQLEEKRREETETETTAPATPSRPVENSEVDVLGPRPAHTLGELAEAAREKMGLGLITHRQHESNRHLLRQWLYSSAPRKPEDIMLAIEGAADMRDKDLIGWDSAKPGTPLLLAALVKAQSLDHTGDGAVRYLYDIAIEHQRRREEAGPARAPTPRVKGSQMQRVNAGDLGTRRAG